MSFISFVRHRTLDGHQFVRRFFALFLTILQFFCRAAQVSSHFNGKFPCPRVPSLSTLYCVSILSTFRSLLVTSAFPSQNSLGKQGRLSFFFNCDSSLSLPHHRLFFFSNSSFRFFHVPPFSLCESTRSTFICFFPGYWSLSLETFLRRQGLPYFFFAL